MTETLQKRYEILPNEDKWRSYRLVDTKTDSILYPRLHVHNAEDFAHIMNTAHERSGADELAEALDKVAEQKLSHELLAHETENADYMYAFDCVVEDFRAALSKFKSE